MVDLRRQSKALAGRVPWAPEAYQGWIARRDPPATGYALRKLEQVLPSWTAAMAAVPAEGEVSLRRRVLVMGYLPWWFEFSFALGLLLSAQGHLVDFAFVPHRRWTTRVDPFDERRQSSYLRSLVQSVKSLRQIVLARPSGEELPGELAARLEALSISDVEYTLQQERPEVLQRTDAGPLLDLRRIRNRAAAAAVLHQMRRVTYDAVVIPNGSILEFGAVYQAARFLGVPTVTYEFGEQRERVWICRDGEAMRLETDGLWRARGASALTEAERRQIEDLMQSRQGGVAWNQFHRLWQRGERRGAPDLLRELGLDPARPVALIATNVVGDSLALNRQVFTSGMADWLARTLRHLAGRPAVQAVVRIHPGELLGAGLPSEQVVRTALPEVPSHVTLIPPESTVNTYDLIESAHVGLVYTSTVGLEMAMHGVPVVTAGRTHYRDKGFTDDPETFDDYLSAMERRLAEPMGRVLPQESVELAWRYAHRFFFEYPFAFPWHLLQFWKDLGDRPLERLVQPGGAQAYQEVLGIMSGDPIDWSGHARRS